MRRIRPGTSHIISEYTGLREITVWDPCPTCRHDRPYRQTPQGIRYGMPFIRTLRIVRFLGHNDWRFSSLGLGFLKEPREPIMASHIYTDVALPPAKWIPLGSIVFASHRHRLRTNAPNQDMTGVVFRLCLSACFRRYYWPEVTQVPFPHVYLMGLGRKPFPSRTAKKFR